MGFTMIPPIVPAGLIRPLGIGHWVWMLLRLPLGRRSVSGPGMPVSASGRSIRHHDRVSPQRLTTTVVQERGVPWVDHTEDMLMQAVPAMRSRTAY